MHHKEERMLMEQRENDTQTRKNLRLKTNNKSTGEAQSAKYLKSRTDYTTQCQLVNAN
jgi:hypothetical protein